MSSVRVGVRIDKHARSLDLDAAARRNTVVCFPVTRAVMLSTGMLLLCEKRLLERKSMLASVCWSSGPAAGGFLHEMCEHKASVKTIFA
jgi:hypothetical protein